MKHMRRAALTALVLALLLLPAVCLADNAQYVGVWHAGAYFGDAPEYALTITRADTTVGFSLSFYGVASYTQQTAYPAGAGSARYSFATVQNAGSDLPIGGTIELSGGRVSLQITASTMNGVPSGQTIVFYTRQSGAAADVSSSATPDASGPVWGVATQKLATRSGPSTKYKDRGTYNVKGQTLKVLSRAWDEDNGIWWVKVEIPYQGEIRTLWTGYKRFDSSTLPLESIPIEW